jgi:conjugal transfer mating pair stabilization protein TraN
MSRPPQTNTVTDCSGQLFCQNGNCFDKGYQNDPDFARSIALMEAARQAGVYGSETSIFSGADSRCKIKLFGLANCCKKSSGGGGFSNFSLLGAAGTIGGQALDVGSSYVYDALYDSPTLQKGLGAMLGVTGADGLFNPSFSFYGFSFQFLPSQGFIFTGFDPTSLAIQIGLMILQDLMSCEQSEQILAMRRGQNLCHEVGTYCSSELKLLFIKICIEHTKSYCCYNSRLARIINEQGREQIGKSWGSPESPNCSGFTQAEFAAIDFSRIDMSEFMAEIMANIKMPNVGSMGQQVNTSVQQKLQNYYQR